jgi:tyrosyl-tRNA synthetase
VLDIARRNKLSRILRCTQIMGRSETDELAASQIFYPVMQCADIFFLKADICQLGVDQRKVNMLAREYCEDIKRKNKPVILSHHMLAGLKQGQEKMSKSDPESAIFMEDSEADVNVKLKKAYCPPGQVEVSSFVYLFICVCRMGDWTDVTGFVHRATRASSTSNTSSSLGAASSA